MQPLLCSPRPCWTPGWPRSAAVRLRSGRHSALRQLLLLLLLLLLGPTGEAVGQQAREERRKRKRRGQSIAKWLGRMCAACCGAWVSRLMAKHAQQAQHA